MTLPNIVFIVTDDQTLESISRMPLLFGRLAARGVFFSNCFCNVAQCQPARATFLSGQMSHNNGIIDNSSTYTSLDPTKLLPYILKQHGYRTSLCGKYMNTYSYTDAVPAGWDDFHANSGGYYGYGINNNGVPSVAGSAPADYFNKVCTNNALAFIAATTEPFFLEVAYSAPHVNVFQGPAIPPPEYVDVVPASKMFTHLPNWSPADLTGKPDYIKALPMIGSPRSAAIDANWRKATEALFGVDKGISQIVAALASKGDTYIFFTSDNGFSAGEWRIDSEKVAPYEVGIHVPLIISGPPSAVVQASYCDRMVQHQDIPRTIMDLAGITPPYTMDGISLVPYLANPNAAPLRNYAFMEFLGVVSNPDGFIPTDFHCVRSQRWKYTEYVTGEKELYDLQADPFEITNLVAVSSYASVVATLSALIAQGVNCTGSSCVLT